MLTVQIEMASSSIKGLLKLENENAYENWKKDINIWCELTDIDAEKRAPAIHLSLTGRARVASSEIGIDDLKKKDGVNLLITKLDSLFLADQGRRQFTAFHKLYNFRRSVDARVDTFVTEFEHVYYKFKQHDMMLPDTVMAFMFLVASNLTESERHLVMSAITSVSYENMKSALKRIFLWGYYFFTNIKHGKCPSKNRTSII